MRGLVLGSEALKSDVLTRHQLRHHRRILPDVYIPRDREITLCDRAAAAWLWSRRRAIIGGIVASALHGAKWVDDETPVELIWNNGRPPSGLIVRNETLDRHEITTVAGLPVTTIARTAFDLGRYLPRKAATARLDALMRARRFQTDEVMALADLHRGARHLRRLRQVLPLVDGGAASPKETWLRLLILDDGLPPPVTQIPIHDEWGLLAMLDMGWEAFKVAAEYDGDHHRSERRQYVWDQRRSRLLADRGWEVVRVINEDSARDVLRRIRAALHSRGWRPRD